MPDLPDTSEIARLARSPSALLNHLSNMAPDEEPDGSFQPPNLNGDISNGNGNANGNGNNADASVADATVADAPTPAGAAVEGDGKSDGRVAPEQEPAPAPPAPRPPVHVERPPSAPKPSGVVVPGDPTLN
jgi:hypothetical protein